MSAPTPKVDQKAPQIAFNPFYWRIVHRARHPLIAEAVVALVLGLICFVPHLLTVQAAIFSDLSWMVGVMTTSAMLLLYHATSTLISLIAEVDSRVPPHLRSLYTKPLRTWLSDRQFVLGGIFFGVVNCLVGHFFGIRYTRLPSEVTIYFGFFVVGFVCGMAAYSLIGVFGFVRGFVATNPPVDYREPDRCGGMSFVGEAIVTFGLVNLVMGVLISVYIVFAPWTNRSHPFVRDLMWIWIGFPFFVSMCHLLGLGAMIHMVLQRYKKHMQRVLSAQVRQSRARLQGATTASTTLREDLEYDLKLQAELYKMGTWPFTLSSALHYATGFVADVIPAFLAALKLLREGIK